MSEAKYNVIGSRKARLDAPAKATGQAVYADDLKLPGQLYGAILHSPHAHARILNIDVSRAARPARSQSRGHGQGLPRGPLRG